MCFAGAIMNVTSQGQHDAYRSTARRSTWRALAASSPKTLLSARRISAGNSRSGVKYEYHVSYTNCSRKAPLHVVASISPTQQLSCQRRTLYQHAMLRIMPSVDGVGPEV